MAGPDERGYFGEYGGQFVPEVLVAPLRELEANAKEAFADATFWSAFHALLRDYVGRPTTLWTASNLSAECGGATIALDVTSKDPPCMPDANNNGCSYRSPIHGALIVGAVLAAAGVFGILFNATRDNVKTSR